MGYGVGFGYVTSFGSPNGLDGIKLEYAISDGERVANIHAIISATRLTILSHKHGAADPEAALHVWALAELYRFAGSIPLADDRYASLLSRHPLRLG